ncbi:nose resistant to fluoxetine protein 6-like [Temnothorax curvispinosus]|uniref:Nose resistant to fluoxetine protein 6-like n=1 Tax=Temnothorax curvispinosus TaxID=300111 RepID=A0A6J1QXL9_9HYME|nr:nose resistant to fluoxetine protein 6-like [Temnothorax curvispinosus]XP_024885391.1 nose resistant to fluoxetine protein 6-like [Temnothorax curvispinosus]
MQRLVFILLTNSAVLFGGCTQEFHGRILPAYAVASKADILNSTCGKELKTFRDALSQRTLWSLKVLDSSGSFKPGFLYGNNYWLGSRSQCLDTMNTVPLQISQQKVLNNTHYRDPRKEFPPFQMNYFVVYFKHNSPIQYHINLFDENVITLGLCLPASCTINNLSFILERIFRDRVIFDDLYSADFQLIQVKDLNDDNKKLPSSALRFICVGLGFSFLMTAIGTIYDVFVYQKHLQKNETNKTGNGTVKVSKEVNLFSYRKSKIGEILICFSVYTNTGKIFSTKLDTGTIPVIHGLKFLSMCSIIILHNTYFSLNSLDNKVWLLRFTESYKYLSDIGFLAVDIFFLSSGCLMTYMYLMRDKTYEILKPIDYGEKLIEFFIYVIKRFIRLTPAYMMVLAITQLSWAWFDKTSQFYIYEKSHETCAKYWWRNILYINNLFEVDAMCMNWSWYLANDMQFYVIATALLILSTIYFYAAVTILSALLIGSVILNGYISHVYEYVATSDEERHLANIFYISPWMRMNPYIIGIITGYILIKLKNNLVLKEKHIILCWCLAILCKVFVLFLSYNRHISVLATSIYVALNRTLWAICIACIIIACSTKHEGIVNRLLSFKGWIPLSRLTYCAYLINPVIIQSIHLYSETSIHFEFLPRFVMAVGYIIISYLCSYALSVMVEMPYNLLMKMFIKYRNKPYRKEM